MRGNTCGEIVANECCDVNHTNCNICKEWYHVNCRGMADCLVCDELVCTECARDDEGYFWDMNGFVCNKCVDEQDFVTTMECKTCERKFYLRHPSLPVADDNGVREEWMRICKYEDCDKWVCYCRAVGRRYHKQYYCEQHVPQQNEVITE